MNGIYSLAHLDASLSRASQGRPRMTEENLESKHAAGIAFARRRAYPCYIFSFAIPGTG